MAITITSTTLISKTSLRVNFSYIGPLTVDGVGFYAGPNAGTYPDDPPLYGYDHVVNVQFLGGNTFRGTTNPGIDWNENLHYIIEIIFVDGPTEDTGDLTFLMPTPAIHDVAVSDITTSQATVSFNILASGTPVEDVVNYQINYGIDPPGTLDQSSSVGTTTTDPRIITLEGLLPGTSYLAEPTADLTASIGVLSCGDVSCVVSFTTESLPPPPPEPTPLNIPIGGIVDQNNGTLGTQGFGQGNQLFAPNYVNPDQFMNDILR